MFHFSPFWVILFHVKGNLVNQYMFPAKGSLVNSGPTFSKVILEEIFKSRFAQPVKQTQKKLNLTKKNNKHINQNQNLRWKNEMK